MEKQEAYLLLADVVNKGRTARDIEVNNDNLAGVELKNLRAENLVIHNSNLNEAVLDGIQWRHCQMNSVNLEKTSLQRAVIRMCQWQHVRASFCDFSRAKFENSRASGCVFDDANFSQASLDDTDFSRASFNRAILRNASVLGTDFRGADLRDADLTGIDFADADLRGADLRGALLDGVSFDGADIRGALFDQDVETEQNTQEEPLSFSPPVQELAETVSPLVASLLKQGVENNALSDDTFSQFMEELQAFSGNNPPASSVFSDQTSPQFDDAIQTLLKRAGDVGIAPLLQALHSNDETPSDAIAEMLYDLSNDMGLDEGASAEDLLVKLTEQLHRTVKH